MDMEPEELQFLGFLGIWRESIKIILTGRNIFLLLSLSLILPLAFLYLLHIQLSFLLLQNIDFLGFALLQAAYLAFVLPFSILSASSIFYTVACIYSRKRVTFKEVIRAVLKLWNRVMVTSLCIIAIVLVHILVIYLITYFIVIPIILSNPNDITKYVILGAPLLILYLLGLRYIAPFCQLAKVVSVLEESYGIQALRRSKALAEGKTGIWRAVSVVGVCMVGTLYLYVWFVVFDESDGRMLRRVAFGVVCLVLLSVLILLGLVLQVVIYLVCKSCNREQIDKSALAYHLQGYSLVKSKDMKFVEQI